MGVILDEAQQPILDEAGDYITDEGEGTPLVGKLDFTLNVKQAFGVTSQTIVEVSKLSLALVAKTVLGDKTATVNTVSLALALQSLSTQPSAISDWLKLELEQWIVDFT